MYKSLMMQSLNSPLTMFSPSRDEAQQEQLWEISINIVKDYLSPEVFEKYGATLPAGAPSEQADQSGPSSEQADQSGPPSEQADQSGPPSEQADQSGPPSEQADQSNEPTTEGGSNAQADHSEGTSGHGDDKNAEEQEHS